MKASPRDDAPSLTAPTVRQAATAPVPGRRVSAWLWPGLALLVVYLATYLQFASQLIAYPFDLDQGEGYDAWSAWLIHTGQLPYSSNAEYPYYSSNYPPLWSYLASIPMAWTGPSLGPARAVSVVAALGATLAIGLAATRLSRSALGGTLAALLFLASPYVFHTTPLARVNGTALLFSVLALSAVERPTRRNVLLAVAALLAALFTKQTALDAVAAVLLYLAVVRTRAAAWGGALLAGLGLVGLVGLIAASDGAFWLNVVAGNANPFLFDQLLMYVANFTLLHVGVLAVAGYWLVRSIRQRMWSPWAFYFPAAAVVSMTVGKWGAGESYFLPAIAAACVLAGPGAVDLLHRWSGPVRPAWLGAVLGLGLVGQGLLFAHGPLADALPLLSDHGPQAEMLGRAPTTEELARGQQIVTLMKRWDHPVISEAPAFGIVAGKGVVGNATHLRNLYLAGLWDPDPLVAEVESRRYDMVLLNAELFPEPVLAAVGRSYYEERVIAMHGSTYHLFVPGSE